HALAGDDRHIQARITLHDGHHVVLDIRLTMPPLAVWLPVVLCVQLVLLVLCAWMAVRLAVRPLTQLAQAADTLDPNNTRPHLDEQGPTEVAQASAAFN